MTKQTIKIFNGKIVTSNAIVSNGCVVIRNGIIEKVSDVCNDLPANTILINAKGNYISPGFIDLHVHGGGGYDFMDGTVEAFVRIAETHAKYGTTSMLPTTLSCSNDELYDMLKVYEEAKKTDHKGAYFAGIHLEGPYLSMNQRGAQDPVYIRDPDPADYRKILAKSKSIKRWSAAPELQGGIAFGKYISSRGIIASVAHSDAVYSDIAEAAENGYTLATHLYSGMSGVTRKNAMRYAGVIESVLLLDEFDVEIIADGIHVPPPLLKLVYKIKGAGKIALITDAMRAAGMPPGESILGSKKNGLKVIVEDGVAKLPDRSSFAGSVATTNLLVKNMVELAGVSLPQAVVMMSYTPARILGLEKSKGTLEAGKDADIVIFDDCINVKMTIRKGEIIYNDLIPHT